MSALSSYRCYVRTVLSRRQPRSYWLPSTENSVPTNLHSPLTYSANRPAIRWILEISTNPDIIESAAAILPSVQWPRKHDASATFARLHDHFVACQDKELYIKFGKAMAHLCIQSVKIKEHFLKFHWNDEFQGMRSRFIRDAFMAGRAAYDKLKNSEREEDEMKHRADTRTALRTLVVHGVDEQFSRPDDEHLIWNGDLRWRHSDDREPSYEEFDWLVDYLADDAEHDMDDETEGDAGHVKDNETEGDALLALSAMRGLGSSTKQQSYIKSLIHCMGPTRPPRVRHTALRAVFEAREELASLTSASASKGVDAQLLNELSQALSTAVHPNDHKTIHDTALDHYLHLLYVLTKNNEWYQRLTRNGHLDRCIPLVDAVSHERFSEVGFYLLVIFGRMKSSGKDVPFSPYQGQMADAHHKRVGQRAISQRRRRLRRWNTSLRDSDEAEFGQPRITVFRRSGSQNSLQRCIKR
ncbi:hypothetical protein EV424DRAFT_957245 [Suillus variegatus]|nr:hypothetical protein EV424DRAFT_957245 [Suillus variegatus]